MHSHFDLKKSHFDSRNHVPDAKGKVTVTNIFLIIVDLYILNRQNVRVACTLITAFDWFACLFSLKFELTNWMKHQL
jgi:hypothetical protein